MPAFCDAETARMGPGARPSSNRLGGSRRPQREHPHCGSGVRTIRGVPGGGGAEVGEVARRAGPCRLLPFRRGGTSPLGASGNGAGSVLLLSPARVPCMAFSWGPRGRRTACSVGTAPPPPKPRTASPQGPTSETTDAFLEIPPPPNSGALTSGLRTPSPVDLPLWVKPHTPGEVPQP